ncbi:MAG: rod shape-determining protein MreC [Clostridia bacterium]|nr:rod shape-determining protein MreC [Clostridia bacterium]
MFRTWRNLIIIAAIVTGIFTVIIATGKDRPGLTWPERILKDVLAPFQQGLMTVTQKGHAAWETVFSWGEVQDENALLKKQVQDLRERVNQLEEMQMENLRLREALNYRDGNKSEMHLEGASVIAREPRNWFRSIIINKGSSDGIAKNMPVVTSQGLVGHVTAVSANTSSVLLILDNTSAVGSLVMIQMNRIPGVLEGYDRSGYLKLKYLNRDAKVRKNQKVITSGMGGIFPKGLPIGKVVDINFASDGLQKYAIVKPFVDFDRLEEVFVIKQVLAAPGLEGGDLN